MFMLPSTREVGVVAALASEAAGLVAARAGNRRGIIDGLRVDAAGLGQQRATVASRRLDDQGVRALVSWGVAGGLSPALGAGDILLPASVVAEGQEWEVDIAWREHLARALAACGSVVTGRLWCSEVPVFSIAAKARLATRDLAATDMESAAVAAVALAAGLPFMAVKVICDPAQHEVPRASVGMVGADGRVTLRGLPQVLRAGPRSWRQMLVLRSDFAMARRSLDRAALVLAR
jgi:adenosylhomocysteine nucleosidase